MSAASDTSRSDSKGVIYGIGVCALLGTIGYFGADLPFVKNVLRISPLLVVILLGILVASLVRIPAALVPGLRICQRPVLRWAVAGLGLRLALGELLTYGLPALTVVVVGTSSALLFGYWVGRRFGLSEKMSLLLSVGGAICGASAVVATDSVVHGDKKDVAASLGIITLLGTIGIVIYPVIGHLLSMSNFRFGIWNGASLHEMAQVVAAGEAFSKEAATIATTVKLARISMLAPVVLMLGWFLRKRHEESGEAHVAPIPWFLAMFVVFAVLNTYRNTVFGWFVGPVQAPAVAKSWVDWGLKVDLWLLCVGMAGVGLQTGFRDLKEAGWKPIVVGAIQWTMLSTVAMLLCVAFST